MRTHWGLAVLTALLVGAGIGYATRPALNALPDVPISFDDESRPEAGVDDVEGIAPANVARARLIAYKIWGSVCRNRVKIKFGNLPRGQSGRAAYDYDPRTPSDAKRFGSCSITVNENIRFAPSYFCAVIAHEVGHLAGEGHVSDPRRLMYPRLTARNVPSSCR